MIEGASFVDASGEWPESADDFERRIVRESLEEALGPLAARIVAGADHLALLKKVRGYAPRAVEVLGEDAVRALVREAVVEAGGDASAWEYVEVVLLPSPAEKA